MAKMGAIHNVNIVWICGSPNSGVKIFLEVSNFLHWALEAISNASNHMKSPGRASPIPACESVVPSDPVTREAFVEERPFSI